MVEYRPVLYRAADALDPSGGARELALAGILLGYWALLALVPVPGGGAVDWAEGKNIVNWFDSRFLPFRKWDGTHDPEGILSTFPAVVTCLLGIAAGTVWNYRLSKRHTWKAH